MPHLEAGKYAVYVWPAYGLSALVLAALAVDTLMRARRWRRAARPGERGPSERGQGDRGLGDRGLGERGAAQAISAPEAPEQP